MSVFVHAQGIKTVHAGGGGQKMAKFCPRSCWMPPSCNNIFSIIKFIQILFHLFVLMEYVKQRKHVPKCPRDNSYVLLSMFWSSDHKLQRTLGREKKIVFLQYLFTSTKPISCLLHIFIPNLRTNQVVLMKKNQ